MDVSWLALRTLVGNQTSNVLHQCGSRIYARNVSESFSVGNLDTKAESGNQRKITRHERSEYSLQRPTSINSTFLSITVNTLYFGKLERSSQSDHQNFCVESLN